MRISTRPKVPGQGRTYTKIYNKIPINFDLTSLNLMCNYVISENRNVKRMQYVNLRNLISLLDMEKYINDQERYKRILFIQRGLEARLDRNLTDKTIIMKYINGGILDNDIIDISHFKDMSNSEIEWICETVSAGLKYSFIYERADRMLDMWSRFKNADYRSIASISAEIEDATAELNTLFRQAKVESMTERPFSLSDNVMESVIVDAWQEVTSSYRMLVTGMQGFNKLIGGGFENTRVYLLLGLTGAGKSMMLINLAYQLKRYNKNFKPKDPTKRPCVVYLTFENTVVETIQRLFQIATGEQFSKQSSPEEAIRKMRQDGELYLSDESPIDILIKFKPNKSEDTSYLYTLVEDLEDEGYEVIALLQDHVKRIRSATRETDIRLELGSVINEFKVFAMLKDIPVITNSHLNRAGAQIIDNTSTKSKADLTRLLGKANVGESLLMLDNVDYSCIINPEYDSSDRKYMVCKTVKTRVKTFEDYICQPFDIENDIKLLEDYYAPLPLYKTTMYEAPILNTSVPMVNSNTRYTSIQQTQDTDSDDEENVFNFGTRYSSSAPKKNTIKPFTYLKIS